MRFEKWSLLALLRFILASIVAVNHLAEFAPLGWLSVVPRFGAFEAVLGFLVISGYSIGESYAKSPAGFFLRRAKRLYPVYFAAMVLSYLAFPSPLTAGFLLTVGLNLVFLNQVFTSASFVRPAWSLALEAWLYACAPALRRLSSRVLDRLILGSLACYTIWTCGRTAWHWPYYSGLAWGINLPTLGFAWILGCRLAWGDDRRSSLRLVGLVFLYHIGLDAAIQLVHRMLHHEVGMLTVDLVDFLCRSATMALVWGAFRAVLLRPSASNSAMLFRYLGDLSYPIYLIHIPVFALGVTVVGKSPWALLVTMLIGAMLVFHLCDFYSWKRMRSARDHSTTFTRVPTAGVPRPNRYRPEPAVCLPSADVQQGSPE